MQNALEGINMYIKKPVMYYYPKQVRRFSFIQTHSNRTALRLPESLCTQILAWGTEHYLLQWHSEVMSVCSSHLTFTECTQIIPSERAREMRRVGSCPSCPLILCPLLHTTLKYGVKYHIANLVHIQRLICHKVTLQGSLEDMSLSYNP